MPSTAHTAAAPPCDLDSVDEKTDGDSIDTVVGEVDIVGMEILERIKGIPVAQF